MSPQSVDSFFYATHPSESSSIRWVGRSLKLEVFDLGGLGSLEFIKESWVAELDGRFAEVRFHQTVLVVVREASPAHEGRVEPGAGVVLELVVIGVRGAEEVRGGTVFVIHHLDVSAVEAHGRGLDPQPFLVVPPGDPFDLALEHPDDHVLSIVLVTDTLRGQIPWVGYVHGLAFLEIARVHDAAPLVAALPACVEVRVGRAARDRGSANPAAA